MLTYFLCPHLKRLYHGARLVHGDLSEYNVLVAPAAFLGNEGSESAEDEVGRDLRAILIDFGQAVDIRHPDATTLLQRDVGAIQGFFRRVGLTSSEMEGALKSLSKQSSSQGER